MSEPEGLDQTIGVCWRGLQFRVVAQALVIMAGLILLLAAILKSIQLPVLFVRSDRDWVEQAWIIATLVQLELLLACWFLSGQWRSIARRVAIVSFAIFAAVNVYYLIVGRESCGCFGAIKIPPWIMLGIDLAVLAGLIFAPPLKDTNSPRRLIALVTSLVLATGGLWTWVGLQQPVALAADAAEPLPESGIVLLEPDKWLQKPCPLIPHIEQGDQLVAGEWVIVLYHHDCSTCRKALPVYQAHAASEAARGVRLASVEMPPYGETQAQSASWLSLKLDSKRDWFATTPLAIYLKDGILLAAAEGQQATDPSAVWPK